MCVIFFCVVYGKNHANERKKNMQYLQKRNKTKKKKEEKKSYFRNENARDWAREKNRKRLK